MAQTEVWLVPWHAEDRPDIQEAWERQLSRELCAEHGLSGESAKLIARRQDMDDALFALSGGRVAEVHLTWKQGVEEDPHWPGFGLYASLEQWVLEAMIPAHEDWMAEEQRFIGRRMTDGA